MWEVCSIPAVLWRWASTSQPGQLLMLYLFYGSVRLRVASWAAGALLWMLPHAWYHQMYRYGRLTFGMVAEEVGCVSGAMRASVYIGVVSYMAYYSEDGLWHLLAWGRWSTSWTPWAGVAMIKVGQVLNLSVYRALGSEGVYYGREIGTKSGKELKQVYGFPFNCRFLPHPQYLGAISTCAGISLIWGYGAVRVDINLAILVVMMCYLFSIYSESGRSYKND